MDLRIWDLRLWIPASHPSWTVSSTAGYMSGSPQWLFSRNPTLRLDISLKDNLTKNSGPM